jgi:PAS domain S-box-containing protein
MRSALRNVGSWERYDENNTIDWSEEMFRIFGVSGSPPASVTDFVRLVHPKDREKVLNSVTEVYSTGVPVELSYRINRPDGEGRYVRTIVEAIRNDRGAPVRMVGAVQDITKQVKTFELLRESERRLKTAEHLAHLGHWNWDLNSPQVSWSEEMFHIFGQPLDYA